MVYVYVWLFRSYMKEIITIKMFCKFFMLIGIRETTQFLHLDLKVYFNIGISVFKIIFKEKKQKNKKTTDFIYWIFLLNLNLNISLFETFNQIFFFKNTKISHRYDVVCRSSNIQHIKR